MGNSSVSSLPVQGIPSLIKDISIIFEVKNQQSSSVGFHGDTKLHTVIHC